MARPLRIGNCSGFYGDRLAAMREMLEGGELDVLTGDYLAELTMLLLYRSRLKDPARGYAATFLRQLEDCLGLAVERGVRIVANAGGLNPAGCADAVRALATTLGLDVAVAHVEGDDVLPDLDRLGVRRAGGDALPAGVLTANAYLGGFGIAACLRAGAQVVVTGRVTDASLVAGPAAWWHGWGPSDLDPLAGATVAGHVLECGAQATGGNYSFLDEVPGLEHVGFPLAEIGADGSSVVTKHPGTGGLVSVGTVTAQLLYELGDPRYLGPDVTADFASARVEPAGADRVRISGVRGLLPPPTAKVSVNVLGGLRNSVTFLLTGLDVDAKAALVRRQLEPVLARVPDHEMRLERATAADPEDNAAAVSRLTVTVRGDDGSLLGRAFSGACVELALASYPGCTVAAPPGDASPYGVFVAGEVAQDALTHVAVLPDGTRVPIAPPAGTQVLGAAPAVDAPPASPWSGEARRVPLGRAFGARSGDKGGDANLGVWARDDAGYAWLARELTVDRLRELLPETAPLAIDRYLLPNLRAVNLVLHGLLGQGVAASSRLDPQAKGLGEWLRARLVDLPVELLA